MKSMQKALIWLMVISLILGIFSSCSKEKDPAEGSTSDQTTELEQTTEPRPSESEESKNPDAVQTRPTNEPSATPDYEITYTNVHLYEMSSGSVWMQAIAEISNTGNATISLNNATFDLQNAASEIVASKSNILAYPRIVPAGEKGYFYIESAVSNVSADAALTLVPQVDISHTGELLQTFTVSDAKLSENSLGDLSVLGTIQNETEKSLDTIQTVTVLYNEQKEPIGIIPSSMSYSLSAGEKIQMQDSAFALPGDITKDMVADFTVLAYTVTAK